MSGLLADDGRTHVRSTLMKESLQDRDVAAQAYSERELEIMPDVTMVSIGGQSNFRSRRRGDTAPGHGTRRSHPEVQATDRRGRWHSRTTYVFDCA